MNRIAGLILVLASVAFVGACASAGAPAQNDPAVEGAEGPPNVDNEWTREAENNLTVAQLRTDPAEQRPLFQEALTNVRTGLQAEPQNPKLWLLAGRAYIGLNDYAGADSAFTKAEQIYPQYAAEIAIDRENAWVQAYNQGVQALNQQNHEAAIGHMERAQSIYKRRPEALINLGWLYARQQNQQKAVDAYRRGYELLSGPVPEGSTPEDSASWADNERIVAFNLAQLLSGIGVERFQADQFPEAADAFRQALELSPYSRDNLYNLAQAIYTQTTEREEALDSLGAGATDTTGADTTGMDSADQARAAEIRSQLEPMYDELVDVAQRVRELDPYNSNILLILARAYRGMAEIAPEPAAGDELRAQALQVLEEHQNLPFQVTEIRLSSGGAAAGAGAAGAAGAGGAGGAAVRLQGTIQNMNMNAGAPIRLRVTFLDVKGTEVGTTDVTVSAPAPEQTAGFEASLAQGEGVVGWKYALVSQTS